MKKAEYSQRIENAFNQFNGSNVSVLKGFYDPAVHFQDPLVDLEGYEKIEAYYIGLYKNVDSIAFEFTEFLTAGDSVAAQWKMTLQAKGLNRGAPFTIPGASFFKFGPSGLVIFHRDYVDLSAMIYERLPVLGSIVNLVKKALHRN